MCCCAGTYSFNHRIISCSVMENKISTKGVFFLLMTAFCWSLAGLFIRASHLSGLGFSMMSSIVAIPLSMIIHHKKLVFNKMTVTVGVFQFLMSLTFIYANKLTSVANAIVLQYSSTIFVLIYQSIDYVNYRQKDKWELLRLSLSVWHYSLRIRFPSRIY